MWYYSSFLFCTEKGLYKYRFGSLQIPLHLIIVQYGVAWRLPPPVRVCTVENSWGWNAKQATPKKKALRCRVATISTSSLSLKTQEFTLRRETLLLLFRHYRTSRLTSDKADGDDESQSKWRSAMGKSARHWWCDGGCVATRVGVLCSS